MHSGYFICFFMSTALFCASHCDWLAPPFLNYRYDFPTFEYPTYSTGHNNGYQQPINVGQGKDTGNQGHGNNNQGYGHKDQEYGHNNQGYGSNNQGYGHNNQGYGSTNQGYGSNNQGYGHNNQGYGNTNQGYGHNNQGYGSTNQGYGHNNQGYGSTNQGYGHNNDGYGHNNDGYGHNNQGYGNQNQGYGHQGKQYTGGHGAGYGKRLPPGHCHDDFDCRADQCCITREGKRTCIDLDEVTGDCARRRECRWPNDCPDGQCCVPEDPDKPSMHFENGYGKGYGGGYGYQHDIRGICQPAGQADDECTVLLRGETADGCPCIDGFTCNIPGGSNIGTCEVVV